MEWRTVVFVSGLLSAALFPSLPTSGTLASICATTAILAFTRLRLSVWFMVGLCWALSVASWRMADELPAIWEQKDIRIEGEITGIPAANDDGLRFDFSVERLIAPAAAHVPRRIRLNWYHHAQPVKSGEHWNLTVRLKRPHGYANPGGLDYEQWLFLQRIRATGYIRDDPGNIRVEPPPSRWNPVAWRQQVFDLLDNSLSWSDFRGIIIALTMGEESGITSEQWDVLRRTGTAHLIAVSGSHIGLIAGIAFVLTRRLCAILLIQRWSPPSIAAGVSFITAAIYSGLAGFAIPTQRALIMIAVVMVAIIARRNIRPFRTLWLAVLAVCLWDPFAPLSPGFWLSFGAVALILLDLGYRLGAPGWWTGICRINWITAVGLAPFLLWFFQQVSLVSPLANLLAVPTLGLIGIPLSLAGTLLLPILPAQGGAVLTMTELWLQETWLILEGLSRLPIAQWAHVQPPAWTLLFALPGSLLLLSPKGMPSRWLGFVLWLPSITLEPVPPPYGTAQLTLLDVGQGLSAVVQTHTRTMVFDTGARLSDHFDMGSAVIEPFLRSRGLKRIDMLVVSHGDNDHIGGAHSVLEAFPTQTIISSVPERLPGGTACFAGQTWTWDGVLFEVLSPATKAENDNDNSCVVKISAGMSCMLLTGDIEHPAEQRLATTYRDELRCDALVAPHHGSKTSSSDGFLGKVLPSQVFIPAGYRNRYGFPHPSIIARYRKRGAMILDSARSGAITLELNSKTPNSRPREYRKEFGHFWTDHPDAPSPVERLGISEK